MNLKLLAIILNLTFSYLLINAPFYTVIFMEDLNKSYKKRYNERVQFFSHYGIINFIHDSKFFTPGSKLLGTQLPNFEFISSDAVCV